MGAVLDCMGTVKPSERMGKVRVLAHTIPKHKMVIVGVLQVSSVVVAMADGGAYHPLFFCFVFGSDVRAER